MGLLSEEYPEIFAQLVPGQSKAKLITSGSGIKLEWVCEWGHKYVCSVYKRTARNIGCPYCSGNRVLPGFNDVATTNPEIAKKWIDSTVLPSDVTFGSGQKVLWDCGHGHIYRRKVREIVNGVSCRGCYDKKRVAHIPLLRNTDLFSELVSPVTKEAHELHAQSTKKLCWRCDEGHIYESTVKNRSLGRGCPYCSGARVLPGVNSFSDVFPHAVSFLVSPSDGTGFTAGSFKKVEWRCAEGHRFEKEVCYVSGILRRGGEICPVCSNRRIHIGYNDLRTRFPDLMDEWADKTSPEESMNSGASVLWRCSKEHEWRSSPHDRARRGSGCPRCQSSAGEIELRSYMSSILPAESIVLNSRSIIAPYELDIYIPGKGVAIEFNGVYWHSEELGRGRDYHYTKWKHCTALGIRLITIWEDAWRDKKDVLKRLLLRVVVPGEEELVSIDECNAEVIPPSLARSFLERNHSQGFAPSERHYALLHSGRALAVISASISEKEMSVKRFATLLDQESSFEQLLQYAMRVSGANCATIVSNREGLDELKYGEMGFSLDAELSPEWKYVYKNSRYHRLNFQKKRFAEDAYLEYKSDATEGELATLNGISRIWDCGRERYKYTVSPHIVR